LEQKSTQYAVGFEKIRGKVSAPPTTS